MSTSVKSSPSTVMVQAPPASPPLQEEPLKSIARPHLHLRRRQHPVWVVAIIQHCRLPSPPPGHCGESPSTLMPPMGSPWSTVPPQHHHVCLSPPTGRNQSVGLRRWRGGGGKAPLSRPWAKRPMWAGSSCPGMPWLSGLSPLQQCHFTFSIRIISKLNSNLV
jgi:hypothetical protein